MEPESVPFIPEQNWIKIGCIERTNMKRIKSKKLRVPIFLLQDFFIKWVN